MLSINVWITSFNLSNNPSLQMKKVSVVRLSRLGVILLGFQPRSA